MSALDVKAPVDSTITIDLRNRPLAGLLAWLWPGAGHFYQRRYAKGALFMVCILGTFFFGLAVGEGKVVYVGQHLEGSKRATIYTTLQRWPFLLQSGVGLPVTPAVVNFYATKPSNGGAPILGGWMSPPKDEQQLAEWQERLAARFDIGLLYTMVAGLLNILAIYDAAAGPALSELEANDKKPKPGEKPPADKNP